MIGTSAALAISGIPFAGPIGAARVGYTEEGYILNPSYDLMADSDLDMVVAGTADAVLMVESEANELNEDTMLGAVLFAHDEMQTVISAVQAFAAAAAKPAWAWQGVTENTALKETVTATVGAAVNQAYQISDKIERHARLAEIKAQAVAELCGVENSPREGDVLAMVGQLEKHTVRSRVLAGEPRIDGRDNKTVRDIKVEIGTLSKAHGSSLFTRGETQAIVAATLGTNRDQQIIDTLAGEYKDPFMLHYNFPAYSVGETGRMMGPGRREIGHGRLARRGVQAMLPNPETFPYTIRVVSEITESNGSSSMASVCGASLALMDAGVPLKAPVAGIAMGLIKENHNFAVLTDILGDEDHLGDMDFKVAGSADGITALQMDIKIQGITEEIMEIALEQAHNARIHILGEMNKVIATAREELNDNAPTMKTIKIDQDKIRDVIGKGGATIRSLCEETGATIDIEDDGTVRVYADNKAAAILAEKKILSITAEAEVNTVYVGKVARIVDFGAFVNILPGKDGLVHISQITQERVEKVTDYLEEGQMVKVKVLDVDARGRIKLTMKDIAS
jgi:polyribonucleotide nucleotidyltransferase